MSSVFYPISLIETLKSERVGRVIADAFEDGASTTRNTWSAQNFKRKIQIKHAPLTIQEYRYLRSFHSQRSGSYDSFWMRDNVHREGNANVRFASDLIGEFSGSGHRLVMDFEEVAPIRALPEFDEVATAAGASPIAWYDPNREVYYSHLGADNTETAAYDSMLTYPAPWAAGAQPAGVPVGRTYLGGSSLSQYSYYDLRGAQWARTSSNLAGLTGSQPACTIFLISKLSTVAARQVLFSVGAIGASHSLGISVAADNRYEPFLGGSETWTNARYNNSAAATWRSVAVVWAAASNTATLYVNAVSIGADSVTRSLTAGPAALAAAPDGTLIANNSGVLACSLAHPMIFGAALTLAQIKAVHNLLGYQYGLATVA